jgi:hypothetical protein
MHTSASSAIAACTLLTVVSRSSTTAEIDTFINDVSTTSTNIAIASRSASLGLPEPSLPLALRSTTSLTRGDPRRAAGEGRGATSCAPS